MAMSFECGGPGQATDSFWNALAVLPIVVIVCRLKFFADTPLPDGRMEEFYITKEENNFRRDDRPPFL